MDNREGSWWLTTLLSALLFNIAWLGGWWVGWLVIPSFLLLWCTAGYRRPVARGFLWGGVVFSAHFHWLFAVFMRHGGCTLYIAVALTAAVVLYFSLLTAFWFRAAAKVRWCWLLCSAGFWAAVDYAGLMPLGMGIGYPFANPCLPLVQYSWFVALLSFLAPSGGHERAGQLQKHLRYIAPVVNRAQHFTAPWARVPAAVTTRVCQQIVQGTAPEAVLVGPESLLPFALNQHSAEQQSLLRAMGSAEGLVVGSIYKEVDQVEQVAYCLQQGPIITRYVKTTLVPLAEQTPSAWRWLQSLQQHLAGDFALAREPQAVPKQHALTHVILHGKRVRIALCLEFFERSAARLADRETDAIFALINDSWYGLQFREWLWWLAVLKCHVAGRLVVYIGHFGCYTIAPKTQSIIPVRSCYASVHAKRC